METYLLQKQNGTFDLRPLINWLSYAKDGVYKIDVRLIRKQRTLDQNRWLWGCVYPLLRQALNAQGWEFTEDEQVHEFFKQQMASDKVVNRHTRDGHRDLLDLLRETTRLWERISRSGDTRPRQIINQPQSRKEQNNG